MTIEDGAAVAEMEHQSFSDAWSEKAVLETLRQPTALCLVAEKAGKQFLIHGAPPFIKLAGQGFDRPESETRQQRSSL